VVKKRKDKKETARNKIKDKYNKRKKKEGKGKKIIIQRRIWKAKAKNNEERKWEGQRKKKRIK